MAAWTLRAAPVVVGALPLLGVVIASLRLPPRRSAALLIGGVAASLAIALALTRAVAAGRIVVAYVLHMTAQFWLVLRVDAAGALYGATVAAMGLLATAYAVGGTLRDDPPPARYHAFAMALLAATLGLAYAGNLLTFFLFYEAFSVLTYALVVHEQTREAVAAGVKYIAYVLVGGTLVLAGVLLVYFTVADATFVAGGFAVAGAAIDAASMGALRWAFACFALGFGVKAALVALHGWVPDAHPAAPAPFSALLSGVLVAAGGLGILRVVHDVYGVELVRALGVAPWLAAAAATVLVGGALAVGQPDLKRCLAYSTISQMGYLTLAVALLGASAVVGALIHLVHHAFLKGTLFFCAGAWRHDVGARRIAELRGIASRTPGVAAAFTVAALGMIGVPPLAGFVSKWWLGAGMLEVGAGWPLAVLLVGALPAAVYLVPIVHGLYFEGAAPGASGAPLRADRWTRAPLTLAAVLGVALGLGTTLTGFPLDLAARAAVACFPGG